MIQNIIINGLINGSIYALLAIGFSLIFGVARIVNIAHTAFYMLAAYFIYMGFGYLGLSPYVAMPLAVLAVGVLAVICYKLFIDPIREHEAAVLIATIALAMVIQEALLIGFGGHYLGVPPLVKGYAEIVGVKVTYQHLLALRATAQDREVANLMGINEARVAMLTMGISAMIAAIAGAIVVPLFVLDPHMWMHPLIMMLAIVVLGGLGSMKGSFVGAYIMAFAEVLVVFLVPMGAFLKGSVALSIMILVLLIRPEGLFGIAFEEER